MLRLLMRVLLTLLFASLRRQLGRHLRGQPSGGPGRPARGRPPRIDRTQAVDVPFTEIPPGDAAEPRPEERG